MKFTIVAFKHPEEGKSILYRQNISLETLFKVIDEAVHKGANLFSIRGFEKK